MVLDVYISRFINRVLVKLLPPAYRRIRCGKVMFLQVSVCPWGGGGGVSPDLGVPQTRPQVLSGERGTTDKTKGYSVPKTGLGDTPPTPRQDQSLIRFAAGGTSLAVTQEDLLIVFSAFYFISCQSRIFSI